VARNHRETTRAQTKEVFKEAHLTIVQGAGAETQEEKIEAEVEGLRMISPTSIFVRFMVKVRITGPLGAQKL
jgi:hypothetical protein